MIEQELSLEIATLRAAYISRRLTPEQVIEQVLARIDRADAHHAWIHRLPREAVLAYAARLRDIDPASLPLYGVPFAIKDNIDLAGAPTTAACPEYAYTPSQSAAVVQLLIDAGAIPIGKTNLDQFATGLVGTRSPYGAGRNSFDPEYISGGSSSGSAIAVALGQVSFALGTDTAGSGRVPAAFNNLIGMKPTRGLLSTRGVVPACRTLDCVSIFALTAADAAQVMDVAASFDAADPYARARRTAAPGRRQHSGDAVPLRCAAARAAGVLRQYGISRAVRRGRRATGSAGRCAGRDRFRPFPGNRAPVVRRPVGRGTLRRHRRLHRGEDPMHCIPSRVRSSRRDGP